MLSDDKQFRFFLGNQAARAGGVRSGETVKPALRSDAIVAFIVAVPSVARGGLHRIAAGVPRASVGVPAERTKRPWRISR